MEPIITDERRRAIQIRAAAIASFKRLALGDLGSHSTLGGGPERFHKGKYAAPVWDFQRFVIGTRA
jgi:hypothetical protein